MIISILACFTLSSKAQLLTDSLIFLYNFEGSTNDAWTNGLNATNNGATLVHDRNGMPNSAYYFDGIDDFLELPNSPLIKVDPPVSFAFWVNIGSFVQDNMKFFKTDLNEFDYNGYFMDGSAAANGTVQLHYGGGLGFTAPGNRRSKFSDSTITANTWHHIVGIIRDETDMDIYIDCENAEGFYNGSGPVAVSHTNSSGRIASVLDVDGAPETYAELTIDQFAMWHRALTVDDIQKICQDDLEYVGIEDYQNQSFTVYPNPSNGNVTLDLRSGLDILEVSVINNLGQRLFTSQYGGSRLSKVELQLDNLPKGIHLIQIRTKTDVLNTRIIIN